jgi:hypothetical protein
MKIDKIAQVLDMAVVTVYEVLEYYRLIGDTHLIFDPKEGEKTVKWSRLRSMAKFFCDYHKAVALDIPVEDVEWDVEKLFQLDQFVG